VQFLKTKISADKDDVNIKNKKINIVFFHIKKVDAPIKELFQLL